MVFLFATMFSPFWRPCALLPIRYRVLFPWLWSWPLTASVKSAWIYPSALHIFVACCLVKYMDKSTFYHHLLQVPLYSLNKHSADCSVICIVHKTGESTCGGGGGVLLPFWLEAAIGGKQYDAPRSYTTTQTENIKQLRVVDAPVLRSVDVAIIICWITCDLKISNVCKRKNCS
jgi:hypothetical protein